MSAAFELVRVTIRPEGAFGVLLQDGLPFAVTLEWTFGERVVIPPGEYACRRTVFHKKGYETYELLVPGHDRVLVHIGNLEEDSTGCILVGLEFGPVRGKWGVLLSRLGLKEAPSTAALSLSATSSESSRSLPWATPPVGRPQTSEQPERPPHLLHDSEAGRTPSDALSRDMTSPLAGIVRSRSEGVLRLTGWQRGARKMKK